MKRTLLLVQLIVCGHVVAQEDLNVLPSDAKNAPRRMTREFMLGEAQKHFDARRKTVAALKTPADVEKRQKELRERFLEAIGGFPEKTPLKARVVGKEQRDGYRVEKVVYESRPDHHVTATLYLPDGKGPFPAVLMPIGHSGPGKASGDMQRAAIMLAKNGIAALPYDPISQGERRQYLDDKGKPGISSMTNEHTLIGVGALLVGWSTASYRIWDGIRSIDYLESRPEIDIKRVGCTGCSGGGTLTSYLMALDERILAAAPSCYLTSLERLFATRGPQDAEQNITGQVAFGMEHADYITLRAPRPTLILAASQDFFDIQGTWTNFREGKMLYGLLGHGERMDLFESPTGHGYPKSQREAMARFMRRWLLKIDDAIVEEAFTTAKEADLLCTRTGQVLEEFKGKSVFHLTAERASELAKKRAGLKPDEEREKFLKEVRRLIAVPDSIPAALVKEAGVVKRDGYEIQKLVFETEKGIVVPALLFRKNVNDTGAPILYLHGEGKSADAGVGGPIEKLVKSGRRVLALDPRGIGETSAGKLNAANPGYFGVDFTDSFLGLHLNRPLLGQRVYDLLAVITKLSQENRDGMELISVGHTGPVALHVAALDGRIKRLTLDQSLLSWANVARTPVTSNQLTNVIPGALAAYDLPDLVASMAPRPVTIQGALDAAGNAVTQKVLEAEYKPALAAFTRQKGEKELTLTAAQKEP
jgi:cephalosporin-C deacetylase-like acetyl esterase